MTYILVSHDRRPLTFPFAKFLTFGFSGHYLDFSLRYPLLMTSPNLQFSRWNVICNAHGYHYPGDDAEIDSDCKVL